MKVGLKNIILGMFVVCLVAMSFVSCNINKDNQAKENTQLIIEYPEDNMEDEVVEIKSEPETIAENEFPDQVKPVFYLSDYERKVVESIVMGEAEGEPYDGQVLVAQCILNACLKDDIQPSEVRKRYKYSGWNDNPSESVKNAVSAVFDDGYKVTDEFVLYFYAKKYASGKWHETQCFVVEIGGHRFFSEWD